MKIRQAQYVCEGAALFVELSELVEIVDQDDEEIGAIWRHAERLGPFPDYQTARQAYRERVKADHESRTTSPNPNRG